MTVFEYFRTVISLILYTVFIICQVDSSEYVPVFMWETSRYSHTFKEIPALATVNADELKDIVLQRVEDKPVIVVFAEENLSVEDFSWRDESGEGSFPNLENISHSSGGLTYLPFVHAPLYAFRHQLPLHGQYWYHLKLNPNGLKNDAVVLNESLLFVNLDDASSSEDRPDLLKRHDAEISQVFKMLTEWHGDVLAIYTAHHSSWHSGEETVTRRVRRLLQAAYDEVLDAGEYRTNSTLLYASNITLHISDNQEYKLPFTKYYQQEENSLVLEYDTPDTIILRFIFEEFSYGYWSLSEVNVTVGSNTFILMPKDIGAPLKFSYHCSEAVIVDEGDTKLIINKLQVQPFFEEDEERIFGDAYDCVYFFTVPIWSGLFVCTIFSLIMAFGLCMIMDIKTMDRFDDPKGKTITISVSE